MEEFSVQVNGLAAEYGRFAGGVINVVTKSGTNQFHGTGYDFLRNSKLDANNFYANRAGRPKSAFKRNQFGGTVGGPVWIPGLYSGRDKTFFFAGYEKTIARSQAVFTTTVPTAGMESGRLFEPAYRRGAAYRHLRPIDGPRRSASAHEIRAAAVSKETAFLQAGFDPVAANVLKYFPAPNATPTNPYTNGSNYVGNGVAPSENYRIDTRVDHNWSSKVADLRPPLLGLCLQRAVQSLRQHCHARLTAAAQPSPVT